MLILQQQKKNTRRKTYKHIQTTEKTENIIVKTRKGLLLDPWILWPQHPIQKQSQTVWRKTKQEDQQQSQNKNHFFHQPNLTNVWGYLGCALYFENKTPYQSIKTNIGPSYTVLRIYWRLLLLLIDASMITQLYNCNHAIDSWHIINHLLCDRKNINYPACTRPLFRVQWMVLFLDINSFLKWVETISKLALKQKKGKSIVYSTTRKRSKWLQFFLFRVRANALPTFVNFNVSFGCAEDKQTLRH